MSAMDYLLQFQFPSGILEGLALSNYTQIFIECDSWDQREYILNWCERILETQDANGIDKWEPILVSVGNASEDERVKLIDYFGNNAYPTTTMKYIEYAK